jgi:ActD protein
VKLPQALTDLFHAPPTPGVLGVFAHLDATLDAIGQLKAGGKGDDIAVYSPMANQHIEDALDRPVSSVRMYTLVGGIAGCAIGAWLTLYMSNDWPIQVGGKPIGSIPPYVVIMFEMTVLFGALNTLIGVALNALRSARRQGTIPWDPRFTNDKWGVFVPCAPAESSAMEQLLKRCGAEEVRRA